MVGAVFDGFHESDEGSTDIYKQHTDLERNTQNSAGSHDCLFRSVVLEIAVAFFRSTRPRGPVVLVMTLVALVAIPVPLVVTPVPLLVIHRQDEHIVYQQLLHFVCRAN